MKRLYIRPTFRGHGLGRKLTERLIAEAHDAGYARMRLDTLGTMREAQALYESLGFGDGEAYVFNPLPEVRYMVRALDGSDGRPAAPPAA